jgi:putative flippase GtrA
MKNFAHQSLRFAVVGLLNTTIGLAAIYSLIYFGGAGPALSNAVGYAIGFVISFALNHVWTFKCSRPMTQALPKYLLAAIVCYLLNLSAVMIGSAYLSVNIYIAQLIGVCIYTLCMFIGCRLFVFSK